MLFTISTHPAYGFERDFKHIFKSECVCIIFSVKKIYVKMYDLNCS